MKTGRRESADSYRMCRQRAEFSVSEGCVRITAIHTYSFCFLLLESVRIKYVF